MKNTIQKISVIGYGNVGYHLIKAFEEREIVVSDLVIRTNSSLLESNFNGRIHTSPTTLPDDQLVLVCVPDDAIAEILKNIPIGCPVAYTSGSVDLKSLPQRENLGVFYPLQTFSKKMNLNLFEVPFFIEASNSDFGSQLFDLAWTISRTVTYATSEDRKKLHLAAVWVNNFTNHVNHIAFSYLEENGFSFDHLRPLLKETARKISIETPYNAQTGPARRDDINVIEEHLSMLNGDRKEIYRLLSKSIKDTYNND